MIEPRPDDAMLEIGDIDEDPTAPAAPDGPTVVIEYRDRGVPWMLIPPLLAMAAVVAGVGAYAWVERQRERDRRPEPVAAPPLAEVVPATPALAVPPPIDPPLPPGSVTPAPGAVTALDAAGPSLVPINAEMPAPPAAAAEPDPPTVAATEFDPAQPEPPAPPPGPRVEALGFDPATLRGGADDPVLPPPGAAGAMVDRAVASAAQGAPAPPAAAAEPAGAAEAPEALPLPPDPRLARAERIERDRLAYRKVKEDRVKFHAELQAICKQFGTRAAPAIIQLCDRYGRNVPAAAKERAMKELGPKGSFVGASLSTRINLLRKLGFPESVILGDLFDIQTSKESPNGRNMPSQKVIYVHAAQILLAHPPTRATPTARGATPATAPPGG